MGESVDNNADGTPDIAYKYTVDANGNRTSMMRDAGADGSFEYKETYELDAQGANFRKLYIDTTMMEPLIALKFYTRDPNGNVIKTENDIGNDGSINSSVKL